ncbi:MAG: hypothetical protein GY765_10080, partial [bacterium]|nr:hypothetical protein [bacterium]
MKRPVFAYIFISLISCMLIILPSPEHQLHAEKSINEKMLKREKGFELGGFIGTPSGLNMRYWFTGYIGLESTMGISLDYAPACTLDLLVQHIRIYRGYSWDLNLFYGVGTMAAYENSAFLGKVRIPLGFSIPLADTPISFSVTIAPSLVYYPSRQFDLNWGIGVRYNFTQASSTKREVSYLKNRLYGLEHGLSTTEGKLDKTRGE